MERGGLNELTAVLKFSVEFLSRVIDIKYGCITLIFIAFTVEFLVQI